MGSPKTRTPPKKASADVVPIDLGAAIERVMLFLTSEAADDPASKAALRYISKLPRDNQRMAGDARNRMRAAAVLRKARKP